MNYKTRFLFLSLLLGSLTLCFSSCSEIPDPKLKYSFEAAINPEQTIDQHSEVEFHEFEDLNLGFFKGNLWLKIEVKNIDRPESYMVINKDLINRKYKFFKLDTLTNQFKSVSIITDETRQDARTFSFPHPNFELELNANEKATYLITTYSDGRVIDATPKILDQSNYSLFINENTTWSIIFLVVIILLLIINIYQWNVLKRKIYFFYIFYMLATFVMYIGLEGHLHNFGLKHHVIDHFVFISIRVWVFSLLIYTSNFLETELVAPTYYKFLKYFLFATLGGTTLYQFIFFESSIGQLHFFENILSFVWLLLILITILFSAKKRRTELKYYLIPLFCFLVFIMIGLIDGHFQILPGDPFFYIKTGTIIEFIGFTYFIARLIKNKLSTTETLKIELEQNKADLKLAMEKLETKVVQNLSSKTLEKTDIIGVFKLIEQSLNSESDWEHFKLKFEKLNSDFLENLTTDHPDLTKSEIRLLTLIKVGYSQKEIAEILCIEPNSVKKAKSRVRKKLDLTKAEILTSYLSKY